MARLGGISSETSFTTTPAGLGSILRDQKASSSSSSATTSASGTCCNRANVLLGITKHSSTPPKALSLSSSPIESSLLDLDLNLDLNLHLNRNLNLNLMEDDEPDEFKEEDIWAAEMRPWEQLNLPELGSRDFYDSQDVNSQLLLGRPAYELGLGSGYGNQSRTKEVNEVEVGGEGVNGNLEEVGVGLGKHKVVSVEVVRLLNTRRREKSLGITDAFLNNNSSVGLSPLSRVSEISVPGNGNTRSSTSWMIPQHGGAMSKDPPRRHAERQSAPVQVPDWSKIMAKKLKERKTGSAMNDDSDDGKGDDDDEDERLPPHELVAREYARSQRTTFSVCEGQGRTLKGRDLSRVRNAVWSQMGFAD